MTIKRFLAFATVFALAPLALAQTEQAAKPDAQTKPESPAQTEQQTKPEQPTQSDSQAKPEEPPKRLRVSSGVAEGLKTHDVAPKYPREAKARGIQGNVLIQATIDTKGNLTKLKIVQGNPILAEAAMEAVEQWKYRPYVLKGEPVEVETTIRVQFHL
jgi:TonB family protein